MEPTTDDLFKVMSKQIAENGSKMVKKVGASFRFVVGEGGCWVVDLRQGEGSVTKDDHDSKVDATVEISEEDFLLTCLGRLRPQEAFMTGRMKVKGNMMLAMKLNPLIRVMRPKKEMHEAPISRL
ncbi:unnamed protein product [Choristocarpus tenellus]